MATTTKTFTASGQGTWVAPNGVSTVQAEAWGGGGGGGTANATAGKGGGGGGAYAIGSAYPVSQGSYTYFVGASGGTGVAGGSTWFVGTTTIFAPGGLFGGTLVSGAGGTAGIGTPVFAGGAGGSNVSNSAGAGGGGAASNSGVGGIGGNAVAGGGAGGTAGVGGGGGGHGGSANTIGTAGTAPGGGGGGGGKGAAAQAGAVGQVKLTYTTPSASSIIDDFNNGVTINGQWVVTSGLDTNQASQGTGRLVINVGTNQNYTELESVDIYDLTSSAIFSQFVGVPDPATQSEMIMYYEIPNGDKILWTVSTNTLKAYKIITGLKTQIGTTLTYSSVNHQWVRIRELSGTNYWDTAQDGINWTNQFATVNPLTETGGTVALQVGNFATSATPTSGTFDNFGTTLAVAASAPATYLSLLGAGQI